MTPRRHLLPAALAVLLPARPVARRRERRLNVPAGKDLSVLPTCGAFLPGGAR